MKIGIITIHLHFLMSNYGSLLQHFALQRFLRELGHEAFLIKQMPQWAASMRSRWKWRTLLNRFKESFKRMVGQGGKKTFQVFFDNELKAFPHVYFPGDICETSLNCDCYVAGSDQIWSSAEPDKLLGFAPDGKMIAYAASAPWGKQDDGWFELACQHLPRFSSISVREHSGVAICEKASLKPVTVALDPTLLLRKKDYCELIERKGPVRMSRQQYILGYFLNIDELSELPWNDMLSLTQLEETTMKIIRIQGAEKCIPHEYVVEPDPYEFLGLFRDAMQVVTNSFHGTVFAIIMQRPFLSVLQSGRSASQNSRFFSLLQSLGLEGRIYSPDKGSLQEQMSVPINWDNVELRLAPLRAHSSAFLRNAIQRCVTSHE